MQAEPLPLEEAATLIETIGDRIGEVIVGKRDQIDHVPTTVLGRGHVLLDDLPGVGKTMLARATARSMGGDFRRIQFTPDLLPSNVTGFNVFNERSRDFEFRP